ncbi:MAG: DUF642 domain-containing protein [Pirellulales bacterium]
MFLSFALAAAAPAAANLLTNGSFEAPLVPAAFYTNFPGGSNLITGWTVVGVDSAVVDKAFTQSGITFQAQDGNQWADLAGITSNSMTSGVSQTIPTVVNQLYEVSFYVGSATDNSLFFPSTIDLSIDGGPRTSYHNPAAPTTMLDWQRFTTTFTATAATTSLTFYNGSGPSNYLNGVDNISVVQIPEPASCILALASFASVLALSYRGNRN